MVTPLLHCSILAQPDVVALLVTHPKLQMDATDDWDRTALHRACLCFMMSNFPEDKAYMRSAILLLANGADPELADKFGKRPLECIPPDVAQEIAERAADRALGGGSLTKSAAKR
jgi:hypothetical protein